MKKKKSDAEYSLARQFGINLRRKRLAARLTQRTLADAADLHLRSLQKIESGTVVILLTTIVRLQRALHGSSLIPISKRVGTFCSWNELMP